jgi:hypothetical protein
MNSHDTIDNFLNGNLNPEEMSSFLENVERDKNLQELLESDRIINSAVAKERASLMNHDLSGVAGAFVAGLAATSTIAGSSMLTAAYAKKAGMSWITLTTSTILSVSLCAGAAYLYIQTSETPKIEKNTPISISRTLVEPPLELTLTVPQTVSDKPQEEKIVKRKRIIPIKSLEITQQESVPTIPKEKSPKTQLEHSFSKYRPKNQE